MKYSLIRALFIAASLFLTVTVTKGVDCTPLGIHLRDETNSACAPLEEKNLTKQGFWSILWPVGNPESLTPFGSGQCTFRAVCNPLTTNATTNCWPEFHTPVATSGGWFGILVVNKVTEREKRNCEIPIFQWDMIWCNDNGQTLFSKNPAVVRLKMKKNATI
jgi:hypothetical protein